MPSSVSLAVTILVLTVQSGRSNYAVERPGMEIELSTKGMDLVNQVASRKVNAELSRLRIPNLPVSEQIRVLEVSVSRLYPFTFSYTARPPNGVQWRAFGRYVTLTGRYEYTPVTVGFLHPTLHGQFRLTIRRVLFDIGVRLFRDRNGEPTIGDHVDCGTTFGDVDIDIYGGPISSTVNLFHGLVESKIQKEFRKEACKKVRQYVRTDFNKKLRSFPTYHEISKGLLLDYSLVRDPTVGYTSSMASMRGVVRPSNEKYIAHQFLRPAPLLHTPYLDHKAVHFRVSDQLLNSWLYHAHKQGQTNFEVTEKTVPEAAAILKVDCAFLCVGVLLDGLNEQYPDATTTEITLRSVRPVKTQFLPGKAEVDARFLMQLFAVQNNTKLNVLKAEINVAADFYLDVTLEHNGRHRPRVMGNVTITRFHAEKVKTSLKGLLVKDEIDGSTGLDSLLESAKGYLEMIANQKIATGVPVPLPNDIQLAHPQLNLLQHTLEVATDVDKNHLFSF